MYPFKWKSASSLIIKLLEFTKNLCLETTQGRMDGAPNETQILSTYLQLWLGVEIERRPTSAADYCGI